MPREKSKRTKGGGSVHYETDTREEGEEETEPGESSPVTRRLSTPYHGLPSLIDYDPSTGFITFGQRIPKPEPVKHPRPYKPPVIPEGRQSPGACTHDYCLTNRRRLYGLPVSAEPMGLPWASGMLKYLPGHKKYHFPLRKGKPFRGERMRDPERRQKMEKVNGVMDEMIYFYKIIMLSGYIISQAKKERGERPETEEEEEEEEEEVDQQSEKEVDQKEPERKEPKPEEAKGDKKIEENATKDIQEEAKGDSNKEETKPKEEETKPKDEEAEPKGEEKVEQKQDNPDEQVQEKKEEPPEVIPQNDSNADNGPVNVEQPGETAVQEEKEVTPT